MSNTLAYMGNCIDDHDPKYICCVPAHSVMEVHDNPELIPIFENSGLNTPDGMVIVWLLRWAGFKNVERVYGPDLLLAACEFGLDLGWRHFFLGGAPEVTRKLVQNLKSRFPGLVVVGHISPPFTAVSVQEDAEMCASIKAANPHIIWVGLGSPKQEKWMHEHVQTLGIPVMVGVGAAFDFLAGIKPQAPLWMQRSGLEWLFRLLNEPRRLWKRYILGYPRFVILILLQRLGLLRLPPHP